MIVPGQLQTADYATAITAETPRVRPDHGERRHPLRRARRDPGQQETRLAATSSSARLSCSRPPSGAR
ncbi:Scr1 family TA system antitoxin-like transcriptional regulator [Actinophytocola sp.]|uniref:Scr1 family TA system antitoxin-like transcriptional regulator n=1 Tax=Actinophytocola sp. TaxID=1872138 RepID=UPI0039C881F7